MTVNNDQRVNEVAHTAVLRLDKRSYLSLCETDRRLYNRDVKWKVDVRDCCAGVFEMIRTKGAGTDGGEKSRACEYVASHGHTDCLRMAHECGAPWDESTCREAAANGDPECLAYAHEHGCPWDESACSRAAFDGHLACLTYARQHGCPWDAATCSRAAVNGHVDCLAYARANQCAMDRDKCLRLLRSEDSDGCVRCAEYIEQDHPSERAPYE